MLSLGKVKVKFMFGDWAAQDIYLCISCLQLERVACGACTSDEGNYSLLVLKCRKAMEVYWDVWRFHVEKGAQVA